MADQDPNAPARFMDLQDPRYAYMFGFLQADGHLAQGHGRKGKLTAEVNARDIGILREFQRLTPYYSSITERTRSTNFSESHTSATWTLCSLEARSTLNELGLPYGRKSMTVRPPHGEFSHRDYVRGIIDADGSVGYTGAGLPFVSLTTASTELGAYLCHFAKRVTGAERTIGRNARDGVYNILYTKEAAQQLAAHLYYEDCLGLERKKTKASLIQAWIRPADMRVAPPRRRWTPEDDETLLRLNDAVSASAELDRTVQSCTMRLWRLRTGKP
ncbi:hypothetical protein [Streptomyces sp. NPDC090112]|uniref:hypothetical protein n=1 Tax=Streptomyces sp. NPDC090112 TaxID=3365949 RepID=UPI00382811F7